MPRTALASLRNSEYTDRELLHILDDTGDYDGWASTSELEKVIRIAHPEGKNGNDREKYAMRCIATRYSWMVRFKWVERNEDRTQWRVTDIGREYMAGKLTKAVQTALDKMKPGDRILAMRSITQGYQKKDPGSIMLRREFQHDTGSR